MTLQSRDKRALAALGVALVITIAAVYWPTQTAVPAVQFSAPQAEERLARLRSIAATIPAKRKLLEGVQAQVAAREKGLINADTAAQAQAQLVQLLRKLARSQAPPLELRQVDLGPVRTLGNDYGEALVSVSTNCRIEQLVNLLADITAQPELVATHDLQVQAGDAKQKMLGVRLTVSGVLPRKLAPEKKASGAF